VTVQVVDYAFTHPSIADLKAAGVKTVGRYYGQAGEPKNLTKAEAESLTSAGFEILSVYEFGAQQAAAGAAQAQADLKLFESQRTACGQPTGRPCYFAVDFDIPDYAPKYPNEPQYSLAKLGPVAAYFRVLRAALGQDCGGYGGYWFIKRAFDAGLISWGWQTLAWSGGAWDTRAQLRQTGQTEWGNVADVDTPERTDYGQWHVGQVIPPPAPPIPQPTGPTLADALVGARTTLAYLEAQQAK
jgi:Domain of unknown function (DUF1906)